MAIYFIQYGENGPVKIGHTKNILARLSALQSATPIELRLLAAYEGHRGHEIAIHAALNEYQHQGEWFNPVSQVLEFNPGLPKMDVLTRSPRRRNLVALRNRRHHPDAPHPLTYVFEAAGGINALADICGVNRTTPYAWTRVPVHHVRAVARATRLPLYRLRPDVYQAPGRRG